jgi:hypothetical protein
MYATPYWDVLRQHRGKPVSTHTMLQVVSRCRGSCSIMALVNGDTEICYEVATEFVGEEKRAMRKVDNRKSARKLDKPVIGKERI